MQVFINEQWKYILYSLLYGVVCGILHDFLCEIPSSLKLPKKILFFFDTSFVLISAGLILAVAFTTNFGVLRGYAILSSASSFFLYRLTIGGVFIKAERYIINKIQLILNYFFNISKLALDFFINFVKIIMVNYQIRRYKRKLFARINKSFSGKETNGKQRRKKAT